MKSTESKIILRPLSLDDLDIMVELTNDPDVTLFIPGMISDRGGLAEWIKGITAADHEFMILLDNRPIGECSLLEKADSGEIGIMLFPTYWRIGYGTEAVKLLTALAEELKLKTLTATTSRMNVPCIRLLQKMGFQETAIGWMVDEEKIDDSGPLKELFGTVMFEKTI